MEPLGDPAVDSSGYGEVTDRMFEGADARLKAGLFPSRGPFRGPTQCEVGVHEVHAGALNDLLSYSTVLHKTPNVTPLASISAPADT